MRRQPCSAPPPGAPLGSTGSRCYVRGFARRCTDEPRRPNSGVPPCPRPTTPVTWLTQEAYDRLSQRARRARSPTVRRWPRRSTTAAKRATCARTAATTPPARSRASRRAASCSCRSCCASAKVGEAPVSDGVAGPGMVVEVRFDGDDEVETFLIGSREESETAARRGLLRRLAAGQGAHRRARGRHRRVRDAERQDDEGHARQREPYSG